MALSVLLDWRWRIPIMDAGMRLTATRRWLLGTGAVASAVLLLTVVGSERPPSERAVEQRLRALAASADFRLSPRELE